MPLFNVVVREHAYTGRFYSDVVQAGSVQEALQVAAGHAAVPDAVPDLVPDAVPDAGQVPRREDAPQATAAHQPPQSPAPPVPAPPVPAPSGPAPPVPAPSGAAPYRPAPPVPAPSGPAPRQGFSVVVREQACPEPVHSEIVQAGSVQEALQVAAAHAAAPEPPPGPVPLAAAAGRPRCADVWVYALLHCELAAGHDGPHMAIAQGYRRSVRWVRDERGIASAVPDPAAGAAVVSPGPPAG